MKISKRKDRNLYIASVLLPNGKYKKVYGKTKKEVREKADSLSFDIKQGKFVEEKEITYSAWLDEWCKNYLININENTKISYEGVVRNHLKPYFKNKRLQNITHNNIQNFITDLSKKVSPKTVRNIYLVIHRSLKDARINGYIAVNPSDDIILPRVPKREMRVLELEEINLFLRAAYEQNPLYGECLEFMLHTGLRVGEFVGLTIDAYNPKTKVLTINKQYQPRLKQFIPPKHGVIRELVLDTRSSEIIEKHIEEVKRLQERRSDFNEIGLIFLNDNFEIIRDNTLRKFIKRVCKKIDIEPIRLHDLRHTFATLSLESGTDIKTIQKRLGHADATFTMNIYAHSTQNMNKTAASNLDKIFEKCTQNVPNPDN